MHFEVIQEEILRALAVVSRAVSSRTQLPVLSAVKIEATKTDLILSATDLEIGIKVSVGAKVITGGVAAVPAKTLLELLSSLAPGKIVCELSEGSLKISSSGFKGKILTVDVSEFPAMPGFGGEIGEVSASTLTKAVTNVAFASAKDSLRPVLTGILIEAGRQVRLVATDGFRLAISTVGFKEMSENGGSYLVPSRAMAELSKIIKDGQVKVGYLAESKQIVFAGEGVLIASQLIEGNFPDYNKILPKEFSAELTASREDLLAAVRTVQVFAKDNSNMMRWSVTENKLEITSSAGASGEGKNEVAIKNEGEDLEVVFNTKYVADYLSLLTGESVWIGLGGKLAPGMIAESEKTKDQSFYVVMPINA